MMRKVRFQESPAFFALALAASVLPGIAVEAGEKIDFSSDILPILSDKCFICHGPDEKTLEADLRLDSFEGATRDLGGYAALVPGDPDKSELFFRILDTEDPMPPTKSKLTLSTVEIDLLRQWIEQGGEYSEHWAFVKPERPSVPKGDYGPHPIDAFIGARLEKENLRFAKETEPERLIRRVTLDLTGLPPTWEEIDAFVSAYEKQGEPAYEALVDRLLRSPRYGETMALPWLEAARFADTDGYQFDGPRHQWRWRDWVIEAYNNHMPFDQFTIEQLAGDLLPNATLDQVIATGFNRNHRYNSEAGLVVEEFLLENAVDRVDTTSTLWMGLTMGCARCHDHKYDPISQKDYYRLIAFFNSVPEAGRAIKQGNSEPVILAPTREQQKELAKKEQALAKARAALKPGDKPQQGGALIDRKLVSRYEWTAIPEKGATMSGTPVIENDALVLDGESDILLSGQAKALTFRANSRFSIAFWVKPEEGGEGVLLSRQKGGSTRPGIEVALVEKGRLRFDLISRWRAGVGRVTTRDAIPAGKWSQVTITVDGEQSANGQHIYLDGERVEVVVADNTNSNVGGVSEKEPLRIGSGIRPGAKKFAGAIRDLRLYQTDLWSEEIALLAAPYGGDRRKEFSRIKTTPSYAAYVKAREELESYQRSLPDLMVMKDASEPKPTFVRNRGVYDDYGEKVERGVPGQLPPLDEGLPRNRLGFAKWLVSGEHPLTARVAVNRYWQKYFGTGLVKTAEDFGIQGEKPSHPDLLDWLATEFVKSGWDVAGMQKLLVTSRTYRQDSRLTSHLREIDPDNRLLARGPRMRLTGQAIRDQALFVSGLLVEEIGGPSVSPYQPENLWAEMSMGMKYKPSKGKDLYRRSLYTIWKRTVAPPAMAAFDAADREACWVNRKETNTPLQALALLNEPGFVESARNLAVRVVREGGEDRLGFAFRTVTSRAPTPEERQVLEAALSEYSKSFEGNPVEAKALLSVGESPLPKDLPVEEIAAWTAMANTLLNLDETITRK